MTDTSTNPCGYAEKANRWENARIVYQAQRDHEVELNKASAAFEHSAASPLFLLNGGAAVAFLTLLGTTNKETAPAFGVDLVLAVVATSVWAASLILAALAVRAGYDSQRHFTRAVRGRRELAEATLDLDPEFRSSLRLLDCDPSKERELGLASQKIWRRFIAMSQAGFVVGILVAASAILLEAREVGKLHNPIDVQTLVLIIAFSVVLGVVGALLTIAARSKWKDRQQRTRSKRAEKMASAGTST